MGHVKQWGLGDESGYIQAQAYYPLYQLPDRWVTASQGYRATTIIVRTPLAVSAVMPAIKKAVYGAGKEQPVYDIQTMQEIASRSMSTQRLPMILLAGFAGLALLLASVGIYGVVSYSVAQRVHEIGIRMALGAEQGDVLRLVLRQGARMALLGVVIGLVAALGLTRLVATLLFDVSPHDPLTLASVAALLVLVALAACYVPARRATKGRRKNNYHELVVSLS